MTPAGAAPQGRPAGATPPGPAAGAGVDLATPRRFHVVGIGGAGMSAIATVLVAMGHTVSGSDLRDSPVLDRLRALGVHVMVGHRAEHVAGVDAVAVSTAIPATNPEVRAARDAAVPVLRRAEVLAAVVASRRSIAVSGTAGKTTTSSMLSTVLVGAGLQPSFLVGGDVNEIGGGAVWGRGDWLVVEADESDGTFVELPAEAVVVTSVEPDHLDHWGSFEALQRAFVRFVEQAPGPRLVCADDPGASALAAAVATTSGALTYGVAPGADYRIEGLVLSGQGTSFTLAGPAGPLGEVVLPIPGAHNARNAAAALAMADRIGVRFAEGRDALARYGGVARRFESRGHAGGVTFVDDYAHLPGKCAAALAAARQVATGRVVCVFQPHRYSRTAALWRDFGPALGGADVLVVTDVYGAGEAPRPGVTGELVARSAREANPGLAVSFVAHRADLVDAVVALLRPGDLCLTMGAGDITSLPDDLVGALGGPGTGR